MQVTGIAFTAYPGKDVQKLLEFYRDALGLRVDRAHPDEVQARFVEFDLGNNQWFSLVPESFLERPAGSGGGVVFEVDDIDAALERVRPHATKVDEKPADYPNCRMAEFDDPEGNRVGLHQTKRSAA
jgi:predicted enzyme related to lactoylglutathione lyase